MNGNETMTRFTCEQHEKKKKEAAYWKFTGPSALALLINPERIPQNAPGGEGGGLPTYTGDLLPRTRKPQRPWGMERVTGAGQELCGITTHV